jgi:organic radical activating enzyme
LTEQLAARGLKIFLETSGAHPLSGRFDWICLSPKKQQPPVDSVFACASELKIIIETPDDFRWAEQNAAKVTPECMLYLQPEWSRYDRMIAEIVEYAKAHPRWNISVQTHKYMRIP